MLDASWDTILHVGGGPEDTLLLQPWLIAAGEGALYVYDYADSRVKAFSPDGTPVWSFGHPGEGPGEFLNATDLEVDPDGGVWVADGGTGRITALSPEGEPLALLGPLAQPVDRIVALEDELLGIPLSARDLWVALDSAGRITETGAYPDSSVLAASPYTRQAKVASGQSGRWAIVFPFGDTFFSYRGKEPVCVGRLIEGAPLPQGEVRVADLPVWAPGVAFLSGAMAVLPGRATRAKQWLLDLYDPETCQYLGSVRLPVQARALASIGGDLFVEYEDPAPEILGLRRRP